MIQERLGALRRAMTAAGIDYYLIPTADFHNSEYVSDYFKAREYFSNFTGSAGTLLVWQEGAGLWTDGRYFLQAERELEGTGITLFRMMEEGVPTIPDFLENRMLQGQTLGFDGRVLTAAAGIKYEQKLGEKEIRLAWEQDLAGECWQERPDFPAGKITVLKEEIAGYGVQEKLAAVREKMKASEAEGFWLTKLDDLMWLFNIRGCDVECNPVAMCCGYITGEDAVIFLQEEALTEEASEYFAAQKVRVLPYHGGEEFVRTLPSGQRIMTDLRYCSYAFYKLLSDGQTVLSRQNPTELLKARKHPVELDNLEQIYLKDSLAVTRFIYWLKTNIGKMEMTEVSVAEKLLEFRREIPEFLGLSFPTIAGYGENGAIVHYEADPETCAELSPAGMLLVDSGGQYTGGTTDVTRTIVLGCVSPEMKMHYTLVASGMLQLAAARWLKGCTGRNLDILARQPLWNRGLEYNHGTGHGIGYMLNVHEGPQNIRWRYSRELEETVLEEGMIVSDEPGVYIAGSHGVRLENILAVKEDIKNEYGQFMHFDTLTWVPLDPEGIEEKYLTDTARALLYAYQQEVYNKLSPYLSEEEREWLHRETADPGGF